MEKAPQKHDSGFMNGFIFGLIVGAAVVFLLATKKGRQVFKLITEEGFDNVSKMFEDYLKHEQKEEKTQAEEAEELAEEDLIEVEEVEVPEEPKIIAKHSNGEAKIAKPKRRFFRRVSRP